MAKATEQEDSQKTSAHASDGLTFDSLCDGQLCSPLFSVLPAEVRELVLEFALTEHEDMNEAYDIDTCYRRPGYMAPRRTYTAILRTCQAIYREAWFLVWTQARQTFFLTADGRRPRKTTEISDFVNVMQRIEALHPEMPARRKEIANAQIFAQCWAIEPGHKLQLILREPTFRPRTITTTFRHTDIWWWESDSPMFIRTGWVRTCRFPDSVTAIRVQIESTIRRKPQVDDLVASIRKDWFFRRKDGTHLICKPESTNEVLQWEGSSTWDTNRWVMDETIERPGIIKYYCLTALFRPVSNEGDPHEYAERESRPIPGEVRASEQSIIDTKDGTVDGHYCVPVRDLPSDDDFISSFREAPKDEAVRVYQNLRVADLNEDDPDEVDDEEIQYDVYSDYDQDDEDYDDDAEDEDDAD